MDHTVPPPPPLQPPTSSAQRQDGRAAATGPPTAGTFVRFASAEEIAARLRRRFPSLLPEVVDDFAYAVSINKYSYIDAKRMLTELSTISTVEQAIVDAVEAEKEKERYRVEQRERRFQEEIEAEAKAYEAARQRREHPPPSVVASTSSSEQVAPGPSARKTSMLTSSAATSDPFPNAALGESEVILYVTSMTANRQVRTHCRLLHQLLYLKRVQFTELDIADNAFLQKHLNRLVENSNVGIHRQSRSHASAHLPLLFVGETYVGDYEHCQHLEDEGVLLAALTSLGFQYVPRPIEKDDSAMLSRPDDDD